MRYSLARQYGDMKMRDYSQLLELNEKSGKSKKKKKKTRSRRMGVQKSSASNTKKSKNKNNHNKHKKDNQDAAGGILGNIESMMEEMNKKVVPNSNCFDILLFAELHLNPFWSPEIPRRIWR